MKKLLVLKTLSFFLVIATGSRYSLAAMGSCTLTSYNSLLNDGYGNGVTKLNHAIIDRLAGGNATKRPSYLANYSDEVLKIINKFLNPQRNHSLDYRQKLEYAVTLLYGDGIVQKMMNFSRGDRESTLLWSNELQLSQETVDRVYELCKHVADK